MTNTAPPDTTPPKGYRESLANAMELMDAGFEPRSALKQAASDHGIAFGDEMLAFVTWAERQLYV